MLAKIDFPPRDTWDIEMWDALFKAMVYFVDTAGGDGDGWVITEFYKEVADLFEQYQKRTGGRYTRSEGGGCEFHLGQAFIMFTGDKSSLPEWAGDIIITI